MHKFEILLIYFSLFFLGSCTKDEPAVLPVDPIVKNYLHISHTRTNANPLIDDIAELVDYSMYDMLWLGGDLAHLTSEDDNTMVYVNSIFDLGSEKTLWALGNHDYSDLNRIENFTNRPPYYSYHSDGITLIVIDTQDSLSNVIGAQRDFVEGILDTIQESSHLIILHHKLLWMYGNTELESQISAVSNGELGDCFYCLNPNNFNTDIYPRLVEIKENGVEVLCVGGDIGFQIKEFEYLTSDGIYFMASGISAGNSENKALLFEHDVTNRQLIWGYKLLNEL